MKETLETFLIKKNKQNGKFRKETYHSNSQVSQIESPQNLQKRNNETLVKCFLKNKNYL